MSSQSCHKLLFLLFLIVATSCHQTKVTSSPPAGELASETIMLVPTIDRTQWPADRYVIQRAEIARDSLRLQISYSGGCRKHQFKMLVQKAFLESYPVRAVTFLSHDARQDPCDSWLTETIAFPLLPLKALYLQTYQRESGTIVLDLEGGEKRISTKYKF